MFSLVGVRITRSGCDDVAGVRSALEHGLDDGELSDGRVDRGHCLQIASREGVLRITCGLGSSRWTDDDGGSDTEQSVLECFNFGRAVTLEQSQGELIAEEACREGS